MGVGLKSYSNMFPGGTDASRGWVNSFENHSTGLYYTEDFLEVRNTNLTPKSLQCSSGPSMLSPVRERQVPYGFIGMWNLMYKLNYEAKYFRLYDTFHGDIV